MKKSLLKVSTLALTIAGCLVFGTTEAKADNTLPTTEVGGLSFSLDMMHTPEEDVQVPQDDPLAAGATDVKEVTDIPEVKEEQTEENQEEL